MKGTEGADLGSSTAPRDLTDRSFEFAQRIVKLCQFLEKQSDVSRTLGRQLLRAGTAVGANIQEGQGSQSRPDFVAKYSIACKEAREAHYWLRLLSTAEVVAAERIESLTDEANQLVAILTTIITRTRRNSSGDTLQSKKRTFIGEAPIP